MQTKVERAYDALVPKDQIVIDAMIISLYEKDLELRRLVKFVVDEQGDDDES